MQRLVSALLGFAAIALTGCGAVLTPVAATPDTVHVGISGSVHGGQQPVAGARVYIFQASNSGYGNRSVDLVAYNRPNGTVPPLLGATYDSGYGAYYFAADAGGNFSITGDYTCAGTGPVYLLATRGNPGLGSGASNPTLAELAVLGSCSNGSALSATLRVGISEVSTVTGVYALAGYMTAPNALASNGASSALSQTGINNAAQTALGLTDLAGGTALATTPAGAAIPVAKINLLADILAACVNTDGTGTACSTLFANATSDGTATGTRPTDTVTALLNIAHNAGKVSVGPLYNLVAPASPYQPYPSTQPAELSLSLVYPVQTNNTNAQRFTQPAFDAAGRMAVSGSDFGYPTLWLFDPQGKVLANNDIYGSYAQGSNFFFPSMLAIDPADRSWLVSSEVNPGSSGFDYLYEHMRRDPITASGYGQSTFFTDSTDSGYALASDTNGNIFVGENHNNKVVEFNGTGAPLNTFLGSYGETPTGLALDRTNDLFTTSPANNRVAAISLTPSNQNFFGSMPDSTSTGNLNRPSTLAVDSSGSVWVTNLGNSSIAKFNVFQFTGVNGNTGYSYPFLIPASTAYTGGGLSFAAGSTGLVPIVMDGASAAWVPNYAGRSISGFSNAGSALSPASTGFTVGCPAQGVAVDGSGNVWVTCDSSQSLVEFLGLATPVATPILPYQLGVRP